MNRESIELILYMISRFEMLEESNKDINEELLVYAEQLLFFECLSLNNIDFMSDGDEDLITVFSEIVFTITKSLNKSNIPFIAESLMIMDFRSLISLSGDLLQ